MSDYDRNKFYPKKKFNGSSSKDSSNTFQDRRPYKPFVKEYEKPCTDVKPKSIKKTTILAREPLPEDRSVSPKNTSKEGSESSPSIAVPAPQPQSDIPALFKCLECKTMTKSIKLLEDGVIGSETVQEYLLQDNEDYLAVGIIGPQGTGKSTILNFLAHHDVSKELKKTVFATCKCNNDNDKEGLATGGGGEASGGDGEQPSSLSSQLEISCEHFFRPESEDEISANLNATSGIDLFVTNNRIIFLDCQPFASPAVADNLIRNESKHSNQLNEFLPLENMGEIADLQMSAFLMSVCHVIILTQEWFFDSNIVRFIQSAEMLKPTLTNHEDEQIEQFPHLILLHNKALMEDFTPIKFKEMQKLYSTIFAKTKLHIKSGLGIGTGRVIESLNPINCGDPINLFMIPKYEEADEDIYCGHPGLEMLIKTLRSNILGSIKYTLNNTTEKHWLLNCTKVWDHVKKSNFFIEYNKLMP